nr:MAG TPA: hypothetical protein [Caudoviricetes sp.]
MGSSKKPFLREKGSLSGGLFLFISTSVCPLECSEETNGL